MSMFRCTICEIEFDSDYVAMDKIDDLDVCEDCFLEQEKGCPIDCKEEHLCVGVNCDCPKHKND